MSFVSSKGNILCRLIKIELYKIFAIINRAIKGPHCIDILFFICLFSHTKVFYFYQVPLYFLFYVVVIFTLSTKHYIQHNNNTGKPHVKLIKYTVLLSSSWVSYGLSSEFS